MDWKELHSPSYIDGKEKDFKLFSKDMIQSGNSIYRLNISDKSIPIDSEEGKKYFDKIDQLTLLLTNSCNLCCRYCYEQHRKDFGKFDVDRLWKAFYWFMNINNKTNKIFQLFGGEPLIEKNVILNFLKKYHQDITKYKYVSVDFITNGILLSEDLIDEYFSYPFTNFSLSLDIDDASIDNRGLKQEQINHIFDMLKYVNEKYPEKISKICIRSTVGENQIDQFESYVDKLIQDYHIQHITIHPLSTSGTDGYSPWSNENFDKLEKAVKNVANKYVVDDKLKISFLEGSGYKGLKNCLLGVDTISIDASGDFCGCYFGINRKDELEPIILGNIFENKIYIDRYKSFFSLYQNMIKTEEQCRNCNSEFCFQCPAGNYTSFGKLYKPDDMCQRLVKLSDEINIVHQKMLLKSKFNTIFEALNTSNEHYEQMSRMLALLILYDIYNEKIIDDNRIKSIINILRNNSPNYAETFNELIYCFNFGIINESISVRHLTNDYETALVTLLDYVHQLNITTKEDEIFNNFLDLIVNYSKEKNYNIDDILNIIKESNDKTLSYSLLFTVLHCIILNIYDKRNLEIRTKELFIG